MVRGRPVKSPIRENILEILFYMKKAHAYRVAKIYNEIFPEVSQRSIYYHLKKGISTGDVVLEEVKEEIGDFSWGSRVEKIYYSLDPKASVKGDQRVKEYFQRNKLK